MDNPSEIFGQDLDLIGYEVLAMQNIDPKYLKLDAGLFESKWWDYRSLHPVAATYLFAHEYNKAYQFIVKRCRDLERGQYMKGFKGKDIFEGKEALTFWKARQNADRLGIRYDFYIMKALLWAEDRNWRNIPRPIHLYSADLTEHLAGVWQVERRSRLQSAQGECYLLENYSAHPDQDAYSEWALDQVSQRLHKDGALHHYLSRGQVGSRVATQRFGEDITRQAESIDLG